MSTSDEESNIRNTCNVCGKKFKWVGSLKRHLLIHTGDLPYQCKMCGKLFARKADLKIHIRIHTGEKPFTCDKCGKSFSRKNYLKVHIRIHTGEKPFTCDKCGKSFSSKNYLKVHIRIHTGEKPFTCDKCGKSYRQNAVLKRHNGEEIFSCDKCNILFKSKDSLIIHNYVHSACDKYSVPISQVGHLKIPDNIQKTVIPHHLKIPDPIQKTVRPHIFCGNCKESCADLRSFREHIYSAYKVNELYFCDKCYKSFKSKDLLDEHYRTHTIPTSHTDNTYTNSIRPTSQEYFSDNDQEHEIKVELECLEDLSDPLSIKEESIKDEI